MFYFLIFSLAAVVLIVAFASMRRRGRSEEEWSETPHTDRPHGNASRRSVKAKRSQSKHDRRKRH
jgi:hypothetical protein